MGRGRQKAKHTKVARELKYNVPETDYAQLQRELNSNFDHHASSDDELAKWSEYIDDDADDDESEQRRTA